MELGTIFSQITMNKALIIGFLFFFGIVQAQKNDSQLISRHRPGLFWYFDGLHQSKNTDNHKYDRLIFDVTYNDWLGDLKPFQNRWNSIGFNTNIMKDLKFKKTTCFSLGIGFGYGFSTISSFQKFLVEKQLVKITTIEKSVISDHTRTISHRFFVPIELRFSTKNWKRIKFSIGGSFGINTQFYQTLIDQNNSKLESLNLKANTPLINFGVHSRFGLRNLALFGSYQFNNLFLGRGNPNLHQLQFGLSISLF